MRKKVLLFCLLFIAFPGSIFAQEIAADSVLHPTSYRNSVYAEFFGSAVLGSLNYERLVHIQNSTESIALRAGVLLVPVTEDNNSRMLNVFVPLEATILLGNKRVRPELGGGVTLMNRYPIGNSGPDKKSKDLLPVVRAGCRYNPENSAFFLRFSLHVLAAGYLDDFNNGAVYPWIGTSVGYSFGKKKN